MAMQWVSYNTKGDLWVTVIHNCLMLFVSTGFRYEGGRQKIYEYGYLTISLDAQEFHSVGYIEDAGQPEDKKLAQEKAVESGVELLEAALDCLRRNDE